MTNENKMTPQLAAAMPPHIVSNLGENMAEMGNDLSITDFFRLLSRGAPDGHLVLWEKQNKTSRRFGLNELEAATDLAARWAESRDVYAGLADGSGRGREAGVVFVPGLFVDIDTLEGEHAESDLSADAEEAFALIAEAGQPDMTSTTCAERGGRPVRSIGPARRPALAGEIRR